MSLKSKILVAACLLPLAAPAFAQDYLTGYVGWFDFSQQDNESTQFGVEYRMDALKYGLRPTLGINGTTDGAVYGYGGLNWDIPLTNELILIPNFMAGAYGKGDDGKDLGSVVEFRSGIELDYQMANQHRVGIAFNHISNASIGNHNPGAETVLVNYSIPMGTLTR
jgi:lipid A 3-O-deacylase